MKIKVLYTIPNFETAGSGNVLYKLLTILDKEKFEPEIACLHDNGQLFQKVRALGYPIHIFPFTHPMRPILNGLFHCWQVSRFFKSKKYDIIYSFHYHADYSEPIAAKLAGAKWVFVKKNMGWFGPNIRAWKLRSFLADKIIVQNTDMIREFYPKNKKVQLISIGVDTKEFHPRPLNTNFKHSVGFKEEDKIILSISSLLPNKGVDTIIEAFEYIASEIHDVNLVIIGNNTSDFTEKLMNSCLKKGLLNERIYFKGIQYNIADWLNIADLFIQATKKEGEGAPIALQEAMASGCMVLGSRVAGIKDQLQKFDYLMFEAGNIEQLTQKIKFVISLSLEQRSNIIRNLINEIEQRYSLDYEKKLHEKLLQTLLK